MGIEFILQLTINGFLLGGFYATMALGFSTIWGVMRLINLAHGEFLLMGAFVAWFFFNPTREQSLIISSIDSHTTLIVMLVLAFAAGIMISNFTQVRQRIPGNWQRRSIGWAIALAVTIILYLAWRNNQFLDVEVTVMSMVLIGLVMSISFIINHFIFSKYLTESDIDPHLLPDREQISPQKFTLNTWQRRVVSYAIALLVVFVGHAFWESSGYPSTDPFIITPLVFIMFFALGYFMQKWLFNRIVEGPYLTMLLVTFAVSIILQNIGLQIYAADPRKINVDYGTSFNFIGSLTVPPTKLLTIIVSAVMIAGLIIFLRRTRTGYAIRAAAQNKMAARLMGINIHETYAITFGISLALTGMAGAMMGTFQPVAPVNGAAWTLRAFAIVALGGLGKVQGVVVGGLVLGLVESYIGGSPLGVGWGIAASFILLVVMLILRPQGITGGLVQAED